MAEATPCLSAMTRATRVGEPVQQISWPGQRRPMGAKAFVPSLEPPGTVSGAQVRQALLVGRMRFGGRRARVALYLGTRTRENCAASVPDRQTSNPSTRALITLNVSHSQQLCRQHAGLQSFFRSLAVQTRRVSASQPAEPRPPRHSRLQVSQTVIATLCRHEFSKPHAHPLCSPVLTIRKPITMDSVLRQSKAMCPFLKAASPATLRAMSTSARPKASPCGGTMSKLQLFAHRCPVMGQALAVQSARHGVAAAGLRAFSGQVKPSKARIHTSRNQEARAVDNAILDAREKGEIPPMNNREALDY